MGPKVLDALISFQVGFTLMLLAAAAHKVQEAVGHEPSIPLEVLTTIILVGLAFWVRAAVQYFR